MLRTYLGMALGSALVILAGVNVWVMMHGMNLSESSQRARWMRAHRTGGYSFIALFLMTGYFMSLRLKGLTDELSPRLAFHVGLSLVIVALFFVKVLIAHFYKRLHSYLAPLGILIFVATFVMVTMNSLIALLRNASDAAVSPGITILVAVMILAGCGSLLKRANRNPGIASESSLASESLVPDAAPGMAELIDESGAAKAKTMSLRLLQIIPQTHNVKTFRFALPPHEPFTARPGQFLTFRLMVGNSRVVRSYSISSSPNQKGFVEITCKRADQGNASAFLNDMVEPGLTLEASGPYGRFIFNENRHKRIVLLAAGSGITPMMAMLRYINDLCIRTEVTLIYAVQTHKDIIFERELQEIQGRRDQFRYVVVLSHPHLEWRGPSGRLSLELVRENVDNIESSDFFLCGPPAFMLSAKGILKTLGVDPTRVMQESFGGKEPPAGTTGKSPVQIDFVRSRKRFHVLAGKTLLEVAEQHDVAIPYSCRQGQCGTCATRVIDGAVHRGTEDGLDPQRKAAGYVLACVGRVCRDVRVDA